ncbi:MAG: NAD(P)-dependent oxidoreductase [Myxococcota bacterium]|nr:NAD(P)-dependent oxidoreductase [Myxococcota bacterium]
MQNGDTILVTGPTSQVGLPVVRALAPSHRVLGLARLSKPGDREKLEALGVEPIAADLADGDLSHVPTDVDWVVHFAVVKTGDFDHDLRANAEGAARLLAHCRKARAFLHTSSGGVYAGSAEDLLREDAPLGDNHKALMPTYSISKIAAESAVRFAARQFEVPTTIARLSVPYGDEGGWPWFHLLMMQNGVPIPLRPDDPNRYNPLHEDDIVAQIPALLAAARVPALTVNWGGSEVVSIAEWCAWLGELTGLEPKFSESADAFGSLALDTTRLHEHVAPASVSWKEGLRRMIEARSPELLRG